MSKTKIQTDAAVIVTVSFKRDTSTPDTDGHYTGAPSTLASGVKGDLQPVTGNVRLALSGLDPEADLVFFPLQRVSAAVKPTDYLDDAAGVRYRVVHVADYGPAYPQEYYLARLTN